MADQTQDQKMQFIQGEFIPSEARDVLLCLIDGYINFYNLQYLSDWERNHSLSTEYRDKKISALKNRKRELKQLIEQATKEGRKLSIDGLLEVKLVN